MKVLFISHNASRTGGAIALLQELRYISTNCADIIPELLLINGGELECEFQEICQVHRTFQKESIFRRILRHLKIKGFVYPFLNILKKGRFDIIYANTIVSLELACMLKEQLAIPLIIHIHEAEALMHTFLINEDHLRCCDMYITVSELAKSNLIENYGISKEKIVIQRPFSLWLDKYLAGEINVHTKPNDDQILIGCFTNGNWFKATEIIPIIIKMFFDRHPGINCHFMIIGAMPAETIYRLKFDIRKMSLTDKVTICGKVNNPLEILSKIKILLLPSREESFSLVAQEAGIMKVPVVGFKNMTGASDWIGNEGGIMVPYMDLYKLTDVIYNLLTDENKRCQYGENAKRIVEKMYEKDSQMKSVISALRLTCK